MGHRRSPAWSGAIALISLAVPGAAAASVTLGTVTVPAGGSLTPCDSDVVYAQPTFDASTPYDVPAGGGAITAWRMFAMPASAGVPERLLVLRPNGSETSATVIGTDLETFPTPIPANNIVSFNVNPPLPVQPGDELGIYNPSASDYCTFRGGSPPLSYVAQSDAITTPAAGSAIAFTGHTPFDSGSGYTLNVSATVDNDLDAGVTAGASSGDHAGEAGLLTAAVTNAGPATAPITFTDSVASGLTIDSAVAGGGSCSITGQTVVCTITGAPGQSLPVVITVTAAKPGSYVHTASVATGSLTDPGTTNNAASATLNVAPGASSSTTCHIPPLARTPLTIAKGVIKALGCRVGKTTRTHSKKITTGLVVSTTPKAGSAVGAGTKVTLRVSSGPPHRKQNSRR